MSDPLRSFKFLPWQSLFQVSALTTLIVAFLEVILGFGYAQSDLVRRSLSLIYARPLGIFTVIAIAIGVGVLAVYLLERFYKQVLINRDSLWALVFCLFLLLVVKSGLPIPAFLIKMDVAPLVGIIVGVFWKSRRYWR